VFLPEGRHGSGLRGAASVSVRTIAGNLFLVFASTCLALACSEVWLRDIAPEIVAAPNNWALLSDFYEPNSDGVYTWPPDRRIRYVRMQGDRIEFDVSFHSNDLGLVDHQDYSDPPAGVRRIALVGDSFTAGYHGGRPWVPLLRERMAGEDPALYNLGIGGAGFVQFERLLASTSKSVHFTDVVLVVISDDLLRPPWYLDVERDEARFCVESWAPWYCRLKRPYFHRIDLDTDPAEWVARGREPQSAVRGSALVSLLVRVMRAAERTDAERSRRIAGNESALRSIVRTYGSERVFVVHLPVRSEVERGSYDAYARHLGDLLGALGVPYFPALFECPWRPDWFFENDSHPNHRGYVRVASCVEGFLRERVMRGSSPSSLPRAKRSG
jgi:lysophospholipase L1-like esterase